MNEKRYLTRISYTKRATIGCQHVEIDGETVNISLNGILVRCFSKPGIKSAETVHVSLFERESAVADAIAVDCVVTRMEKNTIALQYKAIDYDTLMRLKQVVGELYGNQALIEEEFQRFIAGYSKKNGDS
jgi:hypothetical protein